MASPRDDPLVLDTRRMSIARDDPQPRRKGPHVVVATNDVVELRLRGTNLQPVLEERRDPVGDLSARGLHVVVVRRRLSRVEKAFVEWFPKKVWACERPGCPG